MFKKNPLSSTGVPPRPANSASRDDAPPPPPPKQREDHDQYDRQMASPDDLYDEVISRSSGSNAPDPGRYEAILNEVVALPMKDTGGFIRAEFIIADPDPKLMGRRHSVLFQMVQDDGHTDGEWGPTFYHRMMAKLGYPENNHGKVAREEIGEEKPGVYIKITPGKQAGFVNTAVEGRFEEDNDNIEALREWMANNPY